MKQVVFAGALPGIIGAFLLAISRAIGETMIVVMAAGRAANLTGNPFEAVTTVTVQIVALLTGDQEFDSPKTLAAFALGLVLFVITLVLNMIALGFSAFHQNFMTLDVKLERSIISPNGSTDPQVLRGANYRKVIQDTMYALYPEVTDRKEKQELFALTSASGATNYIRQLVFNDPSLIGKTVTVTVPTSDNVDQLLKGYIDRNVPEARRKVSDRQIVWIDALKERGIIKKKFNTILFTNPDSRDPELAGIAGAVVGSIMIVLIAFVLALPIGVGAALYLDEFAPQNKWTDLIEINQSRYG